MKPSLATLYCNQQINNGPDLMKAFLSSSATFYGPRGVPYSIRDFPSGSTVTIVYGRREMTFTLP